MIEHLAALARTVVHPGTVLAPTVLLALVLGPVTWTVAGRLGGVRIAAVGAALALIGVADVTVLRPGLLHTHADWSRVASACVVTDPAWLSAETVLNVALFVPFAFFAVVACGRMLPATVGAAVVVLAGGVLSVGVEATQAAYRIGACDSSDVVHNVAGAAIGAVVGLVMLGIAGGLAGPGRRDRAGPRPAAESGSAAHPRTVAG
jgi:hypothetical protein